MQENTINGLDFTLNKMPKNEYDSVHFINCNFSKSELASIRFVECIFDNCDFSLGKLNNTAFVDVKFKNCKLLGLDFARCKDFLLSFTFENCTLDYASFFKKKIKKTVFKNCSIKEVDFSECDLTESRFLDCDLTMSVFQQSVIEKVDFRTAYHYGIDLELNKAKGAKFSNEGISGLLHKYKIVIE